VLLYPPTTIGGGRDNTVNNNYNTIAGGYNNTTSAQYSTVVGGYANQATGASSFIGAGSENVASASNSIVVGGYNNTVSNQYGAILGGKENVVSHDFAVIIGSDLTSVSARTTHVENLNIGTLDWDGSAATTVLVRNNDGMVGVRTVSSLADDNYVSGGSVTYTGPAHDNNSLTLTRTGGLSDVVISNLKDTFVTGGTLTGTDILLNRNDGQVVTIDLSGGEFNDTFSTGGTVTTTPDNNSENGVITITGNGGFTPYTVTGVNDTFLTGGTLSGSNLVLDQNSGTQITVDLSGLDVNDTHVTGGTVSNGSLTLNTQEQTVNVTGDIVQSVTGESGVTASTTNGAVTVGIDYSALQVSVPIEKDKNLQTTGTTGNNSNTSIRIGATPVNNGYVGVSVNGVWYVVGNNTTTDVDCYFSSDGSAGGVRAIVDIEQDDYLVWNGVDSGFDLDENDTISLYYNILK
jgi:hypothetical protein